MQNLKTDAYIVVRDGNSRRFTVWVKVMNPQAPKAASVPEVSLTACTVVTKKTTAGKMYTQLVYTPWKGQAFNLTALFAEHGFEPISGRKDFFSGGSYSGAEWWHFSWRVGMETGKTTFGSELLKVYSLAECKTFIYWDEVKEAVYGVEFFG
jgi:hypothetical protein